MTIFVPNRRSFLIGATATLIATPAIVRAEVLMPIRNIIRPKAKEIIRPSSPMVFSGSFDPRFVADLRIGNEHAVVVKTDPITGEAFFILNGKKL